MIEPVLEETKSKYYNYAAKDLVTCDVLDATITGWKELQRHNEYFKEIEMKRKRKISFWSEYKSALQTQTAKEAKMAARTKKVDDIDESKMSSELRILIFGLMDCIFLVCIDSRAFIHQGCWMNCVCSAEKYP